jgi:hypothetical protein
MRRSSTVTCIIDGQVYRVPYGNTTGAGLLWLADMDGPGELTFTDRDGNQVIVDPASDDPYDVQSLVLTSRRITDPARF